MRVLRRMLVGVVSGAPIWRLWRIGNRVEQTISHAGGKARRGRRIVKVSYGAVDVVVVGNGVSVHAAMVDWKDVRCGKKIWCLKSTVCRMHSCISLMSG
jgi:hypothetical protein